MKEAQTKGFYDFAGFRLDADERRLWRGEETISLTPKEFELLLALVERAPGVVGKDELLDKIWKDTFVEEGTLTRNVSWLRKKLENGSKENDADENGAKFIETVPKRGYRFLPPITQIKKTHPLVIEEQTVQHIRIEETVEIADRGLRRADSETGLEKPLAPENSELKALPGKTIPTPAIRLSHWLALAAIAAALTLVVYLSFFRSSAPETIMVSKTAPFSGLPGREDMPAFSPDGKLVAFVWNKGEDENSDIYVKMAGAGGEPVRLTRDEANDIRPTFSPDGRQIAFVRVLDDRSEIFLIPALGGGERRICALRRTTSNISFSPDGRFLAVHDSDESGAPPGIFLVNVENGEKRRLTAPPLQNADDRPVFSPDGKTIVFARSLAPIMQELFVVSSTGGEPRQLTFDRAWVGGAAWSADGERIIFASRRQYNSQKNLWEISASGAGQPKVIATGGKGVNNVAVSPDGRTVAFVDESLNTNIWRVDPALLPSRAAFRRFAASNNNSNSPNFSSDGSRVCFASNRTGNYEIWTANADGSNARQITDFKNAPVGSPRFSPDGKWIVFDAQIAGNGDVFVISSEGGDARRITDSPAFDFMPAWSADGNSIYFASKRAGEEQIYKIPAAGGEARQITRNGGRESYESPDGRELYYSKGEAAAGLWRVSVEGGEETAVSELAEAGYWRYWTVTPKGVYYVARSTSAPYQVKFFDFQNRQTAEIAAMENPPIWVFPGLSVSPDGKTILYAQHDLNASSIMLAELAETKH